MAHYAILDENNIVTQVIVGKDESDKSQDWEQVYGEFHGKVCKRTSYNTARGKHKDGRKNPFRKNYAGIGYLFDEQRDAFIPPKPFESWILNEEECVYEAPIEKPPFEEDGSFNYYWDEATTSWKEYEE